MQISTDRIRDDISAIAGFTETPGEGATRPTFSTAWRQARDYVIARAEIHGCHTRIDAAGNVHLRQRHLSFKAPVWLSGSHIDTVPHGGDYDGVTGIVVPLEVLRAAHDVGTKLDLEAIIFAEEEGPTFGLGMLGSRAWVGDLSADDLGKLTNAQGETYLEAGVPHGVFPGLLTADRINLTQFNGLIEVHIEQGPAMWAADQRLAVVTAIAGRKQYRVTLSGVANHAGSTPMSMRNDALVGASEVVVALELAAKAVSPYAVMTVGRLFVEPGAINVIPNRVTFTIDFRDPSNAALEKGEKQIESICVDAAAQRGLQIEFERTEDAPAVAMNAKLCELLRVSARATGVTNVTDAISGALHDSAILAPHIPTAMLFVPSRDGISHNPAEFSRVEDIALAARVLAKVVAGA